MKKTLVSALTTALVVGAASTTFAAANPFSDVPADHWAYDAVAQLAADGVIEGYGDTTFQGDKNITRYEMAQMVAKAMAKTDVSAADKAMIDKLAAEFADELNNLGVRVSNLEKHADMVKWNGKIEYTYTSNRKSDYTVGAAKVPSNSDNSDNLLFRLEPTAEVNDHWDVHARLDASMKMDRDGSSLSSTGTSNGDDQVKLKRAWAQGNYKNFTAKFGKFGSDVNNTLVFDTTFSGAGVTVGNQLKATLEAGRSNGEGDFGDTLNYQGISLNYDFGKLATKASYQHFNKKNFFTSATEKKDTDNIWAIGADYAFDKNVNFNAEYAHSNLKTDPTDSNKQDRSYAFELNYKGAQQENQGTWGAWAAYRYLGENSSPKPTYDVIGSGEKGWEIGGNYTLFKNIVGTLRYGDGKELENTDIKYKKLFGRVEFFF